MILDLLIEFFTVHLPVLFRLVLWAGGFGICMLVLCLLAEALVTAPARSSFAPFCVLLLGLLMFGIAFAAAYTLGMAVVYLFVLFGAGLSTVQSSWFMGLLYLLGIASTGVIAAVISWIVASRVTRFRLFHVLGTLGVYVYSAHVFVDYFGWDLPPKWVVYLEWVVLLLGGIYGLLASRKTAVGFLEVPPATLARPSRDQNPGSHDEP